MATSLSLIAVFPAGGIHGRHRRPLHVFVRRDDGFAIAVSLLVTYPTPMMASRMLKQGEFGHGETSRDKGIYAVVERVYLVMLDWSMKHRWVIVLAVLATFVAMIPLFGLVDKNFLPVEDESQFTVEVRAPEGSSLQSTRTIMESIDRQVRKLPEVTTTIVTIGDDFQKTRTSAAHVEISPRARGSAVSSGQETVRYDIPGVSQLNSAPTSPRSTHSGRPLGHKSCSGRRSGPRSAR